MNEATDQGSVAYAVSTLSMYSLGFPACGKKLNQDFIPRVVSSRL